ncbi:hypothetical protein [Hyalangium versicolor]|uniref:hypothetical protein n=1 Tax=Hyalangium versicolor TaxID=2861190 RepID=UPI001CCE4EDC|nr:hypothetical protein [Hyalangium versicolor]
MRLHPAWKGAWLAAALSLIGCGEDPPSPSVHQGLISSNQLWRASDNPHVVRGLVNVRGDSNPVLTLEEGVVVRFERDAALLIGDETEEVGALRAVGSSSAPILFTADSDNPQPGYWGGIHMLGKSAAGTVLSHATIEYAGGLLTLSSEPEETLKRTAAGLRVIGDVDARAPVRSVTVQDVIVQKSQNQGVVLVGAGFTEDSHRLTVRDTMGVAVKASTNEVGTLPGDSALGNNSTNAVQVFLGSVTTTQTWPNLGVPYQFVDETGLGVPIGLVVGSASSPTLTLSAGIEFQMPAESFILIGTKDENENPLPGKLKAQGTAQAPIRFVPASASPTKGFWSGLFFQGPAGSSLDYVTVTHAGLPLFGALGRGNINVLTDMGFFVTHSTLSDSSGCGIAVVSYSASIADFTASAVENVFTNNDGEAQCEM